MLVYECLMIMLMLCKSSYASLTPRVLQSSSPRPPIISSPTSKKHSPTWKGTDGSWTLQSASLEFHPVYSWATSSVHVASNPTLTRSPPSPTWNGQHASRICRSLQVAWLLSAALYHASATRDYLSSNSLRLPSAFPSRRRQIQLLSSSSCS